MKRSRSVKANATAKFDETIEVAMNLGVDPRHADQMVRGVVTLPAGHRQGRARRGVRRGDKAEEALWPPVPTSRWRRRPAGSIQPARSTSIASSPRRT
ncbi:MAG: hypothetical protein LKM31_09755 [Sphingobium sp.]|nr:hypothetical protein [Sphingobium sp.]